MMLKKTRLTVLGIIVFFITFGLSSLWFPETKSSPSISTTSLEQLNVLASEISDLLDQDEQAKNDAIQELIDAQSEQPFHLLYLDRSVKLSKSDAAKPMSRRNYFNWEDDSHFNISIPVGNDKVKGLLVVTQPISSTSNVTSNLKAKFIFSIGITAFILSLILWLKARTLIEPIDWLCQQFTRYRREHDAHDIDLPEVKQKQSPIQRRVTILEDLWIKFQSTQDQLACKVVELEESKCQLENTVKDLEKAKEQERRLVEMGYAVAEFGHDIGNANGSILTFVTLLLQMLNKERVNMMDVARSMTFIRKIKVASENISGFTSDILEFAKGKTVLKNEEGSIEDFLSQLEVNLGFVDVPIKYQTPEPELQFVIDTRKMIRVVVNLVKNAWEKLQDDEEGMIEIGIDRKKRTNLVIYVRDNGSPIPDSVLPKMFQSFQTLGKEKGTGLGLAICKKIVEAHGGEIIAENIEIPRGVQFTITIPHCVIQPCKAALHDTKPVLQVANGS